MTPGINDGFGTDLSVSEQIAAYDRWAHKVANSRLDPNHPDHDDLVQEARIGIWQALAKYDPAMGALPSYVTQAAKWKMDDAVQRRKWTGQVTTQGVRVDSRDRYTDSLDALVDAGLDQMLTAADVLDEVTMAYHYGQIHKAIAALDEPAREYVYLRFWLGLTGVEIEAKTGVKESTQRFRFNKAVAPVLREHLSHLVDA